MSQKQRLVLTLVVVLGLAARYLVSTRGHNYDFESYKVVVSAHEFGGSPWGTGRYNYGPIWSQILYFFDFVEGATSIGFRTQIIGLLSLADLIIACFIWRFSGFVLACSFFLNPFSIIITGYCNQFDNIAIALVCLAIVTLGDRATTRLDSTDLLAVFLLGLSLATKHIFVFFILWIAVRQQSRIRRVAYLLGPPVLFGLSFLPYWSGSRDAIIDNVFTYRSVNNMPLWNLLGLERGLGPVSPILLFATSLTIIGVLTKRLRLADHLYVYTISMVAFSTSIALQYLAISAVGLVGLFGTASLVTFGYGTVWLAINIDGLGLSPASMPLGDLAESYKEKPLPILLLVGLALVLSQHRVSRADVSRRPS